MDDSLEDEFPDFVQAEYEEREAAINKAKAHVEHANAQREEFNAYLAQATHDYLTKKPKSECRCTLVVDYTHNLSLPHLGKEQAGETYYYCPLNVYGFGIVDQATGKLVTYIYNEGEGGKGGNNVTSLLHKYLSDRGMLDAENPILSLDIVMDNYSGHNKNRMVLRYLVLWLREIGYFKNTQGWFLVRGHTKNPCDQRINELKLKYNKKNTYTMDQLMETLNFCKNVTAIKVTGDAFKDWDTYLETVYNSFKVGTIKKLYIFRMWDKENSLKMDILESVREGEGPTINMSPSMEPALIRMMIGFLFSMGITTDRML
jgi:hypothetical protein